jgi:hypothetical protein
VLEDLRGRAERFEAAAEEIEGRWEQPELESTRPSIVKQIGTVVDRAGAFIEDAEYRIQIALSPGRFESLHSTLEDAHDRGVSTRVSIHTEDGVPPPPGTFEGVCTEARHRPLPGPFVALVDRQRTCFAYHPDSHEEYGVLVDDHIHSYVFHWYYLTCLWEPWEPLYVADDGLPTAYVDIRHCVRDLEPLLSAGASIRVRIEGHDLRTDEPTTVTGELIDTEYAPSPPGGDERPSVLELAGQVTLVVDTGEEVLTVGGWAATVEEVEATRITVLETRDGPGTVLPADE